VTVQYGYDADGQRVKRTVGDQTTHYVGKHYERNLTTGQVTKYYAALGRLVALRTSAGVQWLFGDHLGSTVGATSGTTTGPTTRYWPSGEPREPQGELPTDRRFTGQRLEASTGLYDYQARFSSPQLGRFLQPIPSSRSRPIPRA
jgi:RHS repeat-associated protein